MPLLLSWFIIIFVTPKISHWFLEKHKNNKIEENKIKIQEINSETKVLEAEEQKVEKEQNIEKIKEKSEEEKWDEEYKKIKDIHKLNEEISFLIYTFRWKDRYRDEKTRNMVETIDSNYIKIASINNLIQEFERWTNGIITYKITDKWKYFLKKASYEENKKENS